MLKTLTLFGVASLFSVALVETFLFLAPQYQVGEPIPARVFCEGQPPEQRASSRYGMIGSPKSVYFRRESEADGWYLRAYNEEGFRDLMNTGDENIIVLGDSFIEGESVNNDETIAYLLDSWNPDLAFREFALGGWGTVHQYRAYMGAEREIDHQLVVLGYYVGNDLSDNLRASFAAQDGVRNLAAEDEDSLLFELHIQLRAFSRAYTFFYVNGRRIALALLGKASLEDSYVPDENVELGVDATGFWLRKLSDAVEANGAELLIVTLPSWNELIGIKGEERLAAQQREVIWKVTNARDHVHVLDLKTMIEEAGYEKLYGRVDKHFSRLGYYLSAKAINEWINGSWRATSVATPAMNQTGHDLMRPDCNVALRNAEAFSSPAPSS